MLELRRVAFYHRGMGKTNEAFLAPWSSRQRGSPFGATLLGVVLFAAFAPAIAAQALSLPADEQAAVNRAIDQGVDYLKRSQQKNGTWAKPKTLHPVGYAALPGLTLLECGIAPTDPLLQHTAVYLRSHAAKLDGTYELSLAILFLDRLGDPKDKKLIQTFALRLIAGQSATGGWGYKCPVLGTHPQHELLVALRHLDPPAPHGMPGIVGGPNNVPAIVGVPARKPEPLAPISGSPNDSRYPQAETITGEDSKEPAKKEADEQPPKPDASDAKPDEDKPAEGKPAPATPAKPYTIPQRLRVFAVVQDPALHFLQDPRRRGRQLILTTTDNSNTQFAILALWTAQRYDVPMNRTLNLIVRRYATSQRPDGTWSYRYRVGGGLRPSAPMTCVGLIGLAVGHGRVNANQKAIGQPVRDPRIINGLLALSQCIGKPAERLANLPMENLYFLWSLERAAVLYNLSMIGDKDWYRWGAQLLISNQDTGGNWFNGLYPGNSPTIDTCLALLFLKRVNLVKDLTAKLPFKPAELNASVMSILAPPSPKKAKEPIEKTVPPVEISTPVEADKPISKPLVQPSVPATVTRMPEPEIPSESDSGGKKKWAIVFLAFFVLLAGGSLFFFLAAAKRKREESAEPRKVKSSKGKRTASGGR